MPPKRDPRRDQAAEIYRQHNGNIDLVAIADQLGVSAGTLRGWKSKDRDAWRIGTERNAERSKHRSEPVSPPPEVINQLEDNISQDDNLNEKQRDFCLNWIRNKNGRMAAIQAGYSPRSAHVTACRLLKNVNVKAYISLFREELKQHVMLGEADIVELHMRIAFADITDFVEFRNARRPVLVNGVPVQVEDPKTGETKNLAVDVNEVRFKDSSVVDGNLISEVSQGRDGAKIKLADRQRSLAFLERYFELNPMDRHRVEYDKKRQELEERKVRHMEGDDDGDSDIRIEIVRKSGVDDE